MTLNNKCNVFLYFQKIRFQTILWFPFLLLKTNYSSIWKHNLRMRSPSKMQRIFSHILKKKWCINKLILVYWVQVLVLPLYWFFLSSTNGSATLNPINQNHKFQHRDVFPTPSPRVHLDGNLHKNFKIKRACRNLPQLNDW